MYLDFGKYYIENDGLNWTIFERKVYQEGDHVGEEYGVPKGYYPRLSAALEGLLNCKLQDSEATSIGEVIAEIRAALNIITEVVSASNIPDAARTSKPKPVRTLAPKAAPNKLREGELALPALALQLLPNDTYTLVEKRRKGRGHTAIVKFHSPETVRSLLEDVLENRKLQAGEYTAARKTLTLLTRK